MLSINNSTHFSINSQNKCFQGSRNNSVNSFGSGESAITKQIEDAIKNNMEEVAIVIDPKTEKELLKISGNRDNIFVPKNIIPLLKGKRIIHNHPNKRVKTLTRADIFSSLKLGIKEIIAVNPTGRYSITFPDYLDGSEDVKIHIYDSYKNRKRFAYENNLPTDLDCSDIEIPETDEAWRHHMWTEMAKRFNWQYTYQQN